jgi:DNA modification methylase
MRIFLLYIVLSATASLNAQGGFKRTYYLQNSLASVCRYALEAPNGNLIMIGLTYDTLNDNSHTGGSNRLTILGSDPSGNQLWRKDYGNYKFEYLDNGVALAEVVKDNTGFYYALGVRDSNNKYIGVFLKFNYNGDTIWQKIYRDPDPLEDVAPQGLTKSVDGGFLITGFFQNSSSNSYRKCMLIKADINGNELWRKKIGKVVPNTQDGRSVVQDTATKKIFVVGYQYIGNASSWDSYSNILVLDSLGNKLLQTTFNNADGKAFSKIIQLKDKNFLTSGGYNANNNFGPYARLKNMAVKFDINGSVIWSKTYDTLSPLSIMSSLYEASNGNIYMGGQLDTLINYDGVGVVKLRVYKIKPNGDLIWKRYIGSSHSNSTGEYMKSMSPTQDGGFIVASWRCFEQAPRPYGIVKIDSTACDTLDFYCKVAFEVNVNSIAAINDLSLDVFPNPANSVLNIHFTVSSDKNFEIKIRDVSGREVDKKALKQDQDLQIRTEEYKAGVYFIEILYNQKLIESKKLIVSH